MFYYNVLVFLKYTNFVVVYNCMQRYNKKSEYANFLLYFYEISTFFVNFVPWPSLFFFILSPFAFYLPLVFIGTSSELDRNLDDILSRFLPAFHALFTHYSRTIHALFTDNKRTIHGQFSDNWRIIDMVSMRVRYEEHEILIYVKIYVFYTLLIPSARVR